MHFVILTQVNNSGKVICLLSKHKIYIYTQGFNTVSLTKHWPMFDYSRSHLTNELFFLECILPWVRQLTTEHRGDTTNILRGQNHAIPTYYSHLSSILCVCYKWPQVLWMRTKHNQSGAMTVFLLVPLDRDVVCRYPVHLSDTPSETGARTALQRHYRILSSHPRCNWWAYFYALDGPQRSTIWGLCTLLYSFNIII